MPEEEETVMSSVPSTTRKTSSEILLELLERLANATMLVEVNIAAGVARNELLGIDD
jgi:hypothetical protein